MNKWFSELKTSKKTLPILSFPSVSLMDITVSELINDSALQARGMSLIAQRCPTAASVSMMDLSVEAQAFGSEIRVEDDEVPTVVGSIVDSAAAADRLVVPKVGDGRTGLYIDSLKRAAQLITDRPVFAGVIGPFSLAGRLMDMTEIMIACYEQPETVEVCLKKATAFLIEYCMAYKSTGASGIIMAEPAAGLLSPDLNTRFACPYIKQIIDAVQSPDFAIIYHNCGNTMPLLPEIAKLGAAAYHFGNSIDLDELLNNFTAQTVVFGNIDPAGQIRNGTPESVYAATTELLNRCSHHDRFVLSTGCDVPPAAPWENIDAFFKAAADFYQKQN